MIGREVYFVETLKTRYVDGCDDVYIESRIRAGKVVASSWFGTRCSVIDKDGKIHMPKKTFTYRYQARDHFGLGDVE